MVYNIPSQLECVVEKRVSDFDIMPTKTRHPSS
jgi:hypothetical protein